jgi:hypothetical protein
VERVVERTLRDRGAMCAFGAFTRVISAGSALGAA